MEVPNLLDPYYVSTVDVYFYVNDQQTDHIQVDIPFSQTIDVSFVYTPTQVGEYNFSVWTKMDNECLCESSFWQHKYVYEDIDPECGDGILDPSEECDPEETDSSYCDQSTSDCLGTKTGSRDALGDCNDICECENDPFNYQCVKDSCGAECETDSDCDDQDPNTIDTCNSDCGCENEYNPVCGNEVLDPGEECDPEELNSTYCDQSTDDCLGFMFGSRDDYGDCTDECLCDPDPFDYQCVESYCGAECDQDSDCDDSDPTTLDTCNSDCSCENEYDPYCGNQEIDPGEECDPPGQDSLSCDQSTEDCYGYKLGVRDSFGLCDSGCSCIDDPFTYQCVEGECGAECDSAGDCEDESCEETYTDYCDGLYLYEYDGDHILGSTTIKEKCLNTCDGDCTCTDCEVGCEAPELDSYCDTECGAECETDSDCGDFGTCNECICEYDDVCGDGELNPGEECDPEQTNSTYCDQTTSDCLGYKTGSRDSYGDCNDVCECLDDPFDYQCLEGSCGAECDEDSDCDDQDPNTIDTCNVDCGCENDPQPYCGDGHIDPGEECEPPNVVHASCDYGEDFLQDYCDQNCQLQDDNCEDQFPGCTSHSFCDEKVPGTDGCDMQCQPAELCGNEELDPGEECDPEQLNSTYCDQSTSDCVGQLTGSRDLYGDCTDSCLCDFDPFDYQCLEGSCGAECDSNDDCDPNDCSETYNDYCDGDKLVEYDDDHTLDSTTVDDSCDNTCDGGCDCTDCDPDCSVPETNTYCDLECQAECETDSDCDDLDPNTIDTCNLDTCGCENEYQPDCNNNILDPGEECDPLASDSTFCGQSTQDCQGTKFGTRDSYGDCDSGCVCEEDPFNYECVQGECGAECDTFDDCDMNTCREDYDDYCVNGTKLYDYNGNLQQDTLTVVGSCLNICDNDCGCTDCGPLCEPPSRDPYCVEGECGAECDSDDDCDDGFVYTIDTCNLDSCGCEYEDIGHCGDGELGPGEECDPLASDSTYCDQSASECLGTKTGSRDSYGDCVTDCVCEEDPFDYQCLEGSCGAECDSDDDCDDQDPNTIDTCNADCGCENEYVPGCDNNVLDPGEECDPLTSDSTQCDQVSEECLGTKLGTRDSYGDCVTDCVCEPDPFNYECVEGECGAECDEDTDCTENTCSETYNDYCDDTKLVEYDSDEILDSTLVEDQCDNTCDTDTDCGCTDCSTDCSEPSTNSYCVAGVCGAECKVDLDCDDLDPNTIDTCNIDSCGCEYEYVPGCDNNVLDPGEECDPLTSDSTQCDQVSEECLGTKLGTRDSYGDCVTDCVCEPDPFNYECVEGECGAECGEDTDCVENTCSETYNDYCEDKKLVEYDSDKIQDSTIVADSCDNTCDTDCGCTDCSTDCSEPDTNSYCVAGLCNADCEEGNFDIDLFCGPATDEGECEYGTRIRGCTGSCEWDEWDQCIGAIYEEEEICDGLDNDCDGEVDEGCFECLVDGHDPDDGWKFAPRIFINTSSRTIYSSPWLGYNADERAHNYAFEGEKLSYDIIVWDKNGMPEKIYDVFVAAMPAEGTMDICIEANCDIDLGRTDMIPGMKEGEEDLTVFNPDTMTWYTCTFTVENSMYGEHWLQWQAVDLDGLRGGSTIRENWFLNPEINIDIEGDVNFGSVLPGHTAYDTIYITNLAEGGVILNMTISGSDFYDPASSGAKCPTSNVMRLNNDNEGEGQEGCDSDNFCYYAVKGVHSTFTNIDADAEGYDSIPYETSNPTQRELIIDANSLMSPGDDITMTVRLIKPEPCNGEFTDGSIFIWGKPI